MAVLYIDPGARKGTDRSQTVPRARTVGFAQSVTLLLIVAILLVGLAVAWPTVKDAVISELVDTGGAVDSLNQSYSYAGLGGHSMDGSTWNDAVDAGQTLDPPGDFGRGVGLLDPTVECPQCDDGLFCNGVETCDDSTGQCLPGTPPACDDGQFCNGTETCNEATDSCDPGTNPCPSGSTCEEATDTCQVVSLTCSCLSLPPVPPCTGPTLPTSTCSFAGQFCTCAREETTFFFGCFYAGVPGVCN